jgi:hypothetical protein
MPIVAVDSPVAKASAIAAEHLLMGGLGLPFANLARKIFYPLNGSSTGCKSTVYGRLQQLALPVDRGDNLRHEIAAYTFPSMPLTAESKVAVLFHGNGMTGDEMREAAGIYSKNSWTPLMVTMGGYPGSDEKITTSEASSI